MNPDLMMKKTLTAIFLVTLLIWGFCAYHFGAIMSPDSYSYNRWSEVLIAKNFNIIAYQKAVDYSVPPYLYIGFVSLVALVKICIGQFWQQAIVIINVILSAFLAVMLADLVYIFTKNKFAAWFTALLYIFNTEIMLWSRYVLSDTSYMFLNFLIFYLIARLFLGIDKRAFKYWLITFLILLFSCIYRPTGLVMIPLVLFAMYLKIRKKEIRWSVFFIFFTVFILISIVIHAAVVRDVGLWPLGFGKRYLKDYVAASYQQGVIIDGRPHTYHQVPVGLMSYIFITIDKFAHYFYFLDKLFSFNHRIINYFVFMPLYALFILGIVGTIKKIRDSDKKVLIALCVIVIIWYALFYAMTLTDFDWRYRLPIMPYIIFIAGVGFNFLLEIKRTEDAT